MTARTRLTRRFGRQFAVVAVLAGAFVLGPMAVAQKEGAGGAASAGKSVRSDQLILRAGSIDGQVLHNDGRGVYKPKIRFEDPDGNLLKEVQADKDGKFNINLKPGKYYATTGRKRRAVELVVKETAPAEKLFLYVDDAFWLLGGTTKWIVGGTLGLGASAGTAVVVADDDDDEDPPPPSSPPPTPTPVTPATPPVNPPPS